jgi:hypothetical protein
MERPGINIVRVFSFLRLFYLKFTVGERTGDGETWVFFVLELLWMRQKEIDVFLLLNLIATLYPFVCTNSD